MTSMDSAVREAEISARNALAEPSWCHLIQVDPTVAVREIFSDLGPVARRVRGRLMRTNGGFDDEFTAAWQLDDYDGPSSGAYIRDCLNDMYLRWPTTRGFVVIVTEPEQMLIDEPGEHNRYSPLRGLIDDFDTVAENYGEPTNRKPTDPLDRPALSFDVVLVTDAEHRDEVVHRWRAAGAPLAD